jgi:hypothetical protein
MNKTTVALSLLIGLLQAPPALPGNLAPRSGIVSFGMYSGEPDPYCELSEDDIDKLMRLIESKLRDAVEIDSFPDNSIDPKANLRGLSVRIWKTDPSKKLIDSRFYPGAYKIEIIGKYMRLQDSKHSKIYEMNTAELEIYLIELGVRKSVIHDWQKKRIYDEISKRKE